MALSAVLLVNLGTPEAPTPAAVKRFLAEFLKDRRVIALTPWLWWPILYAFVLPARVNRVAKLYQSIWWEKGSPMRVISQEQRTALQERLGENISVYIAMRYGSPSLKTVLLDLVENHNEICVIPLYPQFSLTTTASVLDIIHTVEKLKPGAEKKIHMVSDYHDHPLYIEALAQSVKFHWSEKGKVQKLLMSFHGIPEDYQLAGDPYPSQCHKTATLLAQNLGLKETEYAISFQSRFGPKAWVKPYTETVLKEWAQQGIREIDVISPSFSTDCLETLEEIAHTLKTVFLAAGGEKYNYIPALNASPSHINLLEALVTVQPMSLKFNSPNKI